MVLRPIPRGRAPRAAEPPLGVTIKPSGSATNIKSFGESQDPRCQQMISQRLLENFDVVLVDRVDRRKVYVASHTEPQPKEVNVHEYFDIARAHITQSSPIGSSSKKRRASRSSPPCNKRRMPRSKTPETDDYVSDAEDELDGVLNGREGEEYDSQPFRVSNLQGYYIIALKMLGQLACKDIAKAWIKMGHPRKQTTNPYNGGNTKEESLRLYGFEGALTTPIYWPPWEGWRDCKGCRHREPDHIKKPERLNLLYHLLHCGHHRFTIEKLELATAWIEREIPKNFTAKSIKILRQIYYARREEIKYEQGLSGADTTINLYIPKPTAKTPKIPKTITATPIKDEPSQGVTDGPRSAKAPTADMKIEKLIEEEDSIATHMEVDTTDETKSTVPECTPASTVSCVASDGRSLQPKPKAPHHNETGVLTIESPSCLSVQRQRSGKSSLPSEEIPWRSSTDHLGGLPLERIRHPSRKRESVAPTRPYSDKPTLIAGGLAASVPYQGESSTCYTLTENQLRNEYLHPGEHRQMNVAHIPGQQPRTLSHPFVHPLSSSRRPVAPKSMSFSGSSSGFAGLPSDCIWQNTSEHSSAQQYGINGPIYTDGADPNAPLPSYPADITSSFGSDYSDNSLGSGLQMNDLSGPTYSQVQANQRALDADFRRYYPTYLTSNFNALSVEPGPLDHTPLFPTDYSVGAESRFNTYNQEPRYAQR